MKSWETAQSELFGKYYVAANIVVQINKLCYKDRKGNPRASRHFIKTVIRQWVLFRVTEET